MFKKIFQLFIIARKLATSGAVNTINEVYNIPFSIKLFFEIMSIGSQKKLDSGLARRQNFLDLGEKFWVRLKEKNWIPDEGEGEN